MQTQETIALRRIRQRSESVRCVHQRVGTDCPEDIGPHGRSAKNDRGNATRRLNEEGGELVRPSGDEHEPQTGSLFSQAPNRGDDGDGRVIIGQPHYRRDASRNLVGRDQLTRGFDAKLCSAEGILQLPASLKVACDQEAKGGIDVRDGSLYWFAAKNAKREPLG